MLPAFLLVNQDLLRAALSHYLSDDARARDGGLADIHFAIGGGEEHLRERELRAGLTVQALDMDDLSRGNPILFATGAYHSVVHASPRRIDLNYWTDIAVSRRFAGLGPVLAVCLPDVARGHSGTSTIFRG